jgi:glycosyltransferase involved in cell wall biosynthesis
VLINKLKFKFVQFSEKIIRGNFLFSLIIYSKLLKKNNVRLKKSISVINTFDISGGAAKIAYTISNETRHFIPLKYFVKEKKTNESWIVQIGNKEYNFFEENLKREAKEKGWIEFSGFHVLNLLDNSFFSQSNTIHIHNLHGEFFSPALFDSLFKNKRVIWTLHDESFITGHCSCTLGCEKWKNGCGVCPDLTIYPSIKFDNTAKVLKYKKKWITEVQPIIVSPSHWLANRVRVAYPNLKHIEVIPNGIDTSVFRPLDKKVARARLKLPLDTKKIILFVAEFATNNPFKGGAILRELISDVDFKDVLFITVGGQHNTNFSNLISLPYISNEQDLAFLYATADVLLYPTQADNLPLVVLESMACGTPVIASNLGGIPEIIQHGDNGFLIDNYKDVSEFKKVLLKVLNLETDELEFVCRSASLTIKTQFSLEQLIQSYLKIYSS